MPSGTEGATIQFLNEHGLLDFPATSVLSTRQAQAEQLVQLIDGMPLSYSPPNNQGEAQVSSTGEILRLDFNPVKVEAVGKLPILTAQQAWEQAISAKDINGIELAGMSVAIPDLKIWNRQRPLDQRVEMFGYVSSFPAAEAGKPPLILFDGYPAFGNTQGMDSLDHGNPFVQLWGTFQDDQKGGRQLQVEGWQLSPFPTQSLTGTIQMQGRPGLYPDQRAHLTAARNARRPAARSGAALQWSSFGTT